MVRTLTYNSEEERIPFIYTLNLFTLGVRACAIVAENFSDLTAKSLYLSNSSQKNLGFVKPFL